MSTAVRSFVRGYLREPAVPDPPARARRDWALVTAASVAAVLEAILRYDDEWTSLAPGWRIASVVAFFVAVPPAILVRRTHPLFAVAYGFGITMGFGLTMALAEGLFGGLVSGSVMLVVAYSVYRWGSGRDGMIAAAILFAAWIIGNVTTPGVGIGDWIGGFIVLSIPVELGLLVRYRTSARERGRREAKSQAREALARDLHDTVAHHVSAIAIQAQAGRAVATTDPERALAVLTVIEEQASRTLAEMRAIVGALRDGSDADLAPQQGVADLPRLDAGVPAGLSLNVDVDDGLGELGPAVDAAIFRIAQESVTNAVRHARHATHIDVRVVADGDAVRISVRDDGENGDAGQPGFGLLGVAERAHLLGGTFDAGPADGHGWRVAVELPRSETARHERARPEAPS